MRYIFRAIAISTLAIGCSNINPIDVQARARRPESARIDGVNAPYISGVEQLSLVVHPATYDNELLHGLSINSREGTRSFSNSLRDHALAIQIISPLPRQMQITSQLTSALKSVPNFAVFQAPAATSPVNGYLIVRAQLSEFNNRIEEQHSKVNLLTLYRHKRYVRRGTVGLDVTVTDGRTGEIVEAFPVSGTFTEEIVNSAEGAIFPIVETSTEARSTSDQALRAALNNSAEELYRRLVLNRKR